MSELAIRGGRVIDPASGLDAEMDLLVRDGRVAEVARGLRAAETIDARGLWVAPGFIDLHAHLRDPGDPAEETIESGAAAAAAGGFAAVLAMPNTSPPVDSPHLVRYVLARGKEAAGAEVLVAAALTEGRKGERPADIAGLARAGAVAFTDDGDEPRSARVMRACMREAARVGRPVLVHAEEPSLVEDGVMNEGALATELGLAGRPVLAEELAVARDIALARDTSARLHVQHVSSAAALGLIAAARRAGVNVTCEATPHHLVLTEEACRGYDPNAKVNPPLRSESDRSALAAALAKGELDAIATDHAPHAGEEKGLEFDSAAAGIAGLETALGLVLTEFVARGALSPVRMVELFSTGPARVLGLAELGSLRPGARAHITLVDPAREWVVEPSRFLSRGRNTPFAGRRLRGRAAMTIAHGRVVFRAD